MEKNICIIHYNTPILTECLVKSINKYTPGCNIYIFDNSNIRPFVNSFDNVTVFDNTKGQIINFDEWLKKYPNKDKSGGKTNKWGSAKHAYSVERCMNLIKKPFVLLDSDVLIKKDITPIFDESVCYKGEVIYQGKSTVKRVLPFICFINTKMCFENGVHYFDERYMHGLRVGARGDYYDTGAALYLLAEQKKLPHREFKVEEYIVHFANGSWTQEAEKIRKIKHVPASEWLEKFKQFWIDEPLKEVATNVNFNNVFKHIYCLHYLPTNDRLLKLKNELKYVGIDENADYFSWVYDYPSQLLDAVFDDKRLNMSTALKSSSRDYIKKISMKHYEIIKEAYYLGYERILIMEDNIRFHKDMNYINELLSNIPDTDVVMFDKMVCSAQNENLKYKKYVKSLPESTLYGSMNDSGVFFIFSSCYSLTRNAMGKIIKMYENGLLPADTPLNDKTLTGSFAITNLAIQDPDYSVRDEENYNKIGLDTGLYGIEKKEVSNPKPVINANKKADKEIIIKKKPDVKKEQSPKKQDVIFRAIIKPKKLNVVETVPVITNIKDNKKPVIKSKETAVLNKNKLTKTRIIHADYYGYNDLYGA